MHDPVLSMEKGTSLKFYDAPACIDGRGDRLVAPPALQQEGLVKKKQDLTALLFPPFLNMSDHLIFVFAAHL